MSNEAARPASSSTSQTQNTALGEMVESLSNISSDLLQSYERLAARAERVDQELCRTNLELEAKVAEVEAILETLPVGVVVRDASGAVVRVNGALCQILGLDGTSLLGEPAADLLPRHDPDAHTVEHQDKEGRTRVLASSASNIISENGAHNGSIEVFDDRTELDQLEQRVHQMDKMAALGNMAAGIAHEIRNPMNDVKGFSDLFRKKLEPGSPHHRWAGLISDGVREVDAIITSLLSFAQPEKLSVETIDSAELVQSAIESALQLTPGNLDPAAWAIECSGPAVELRADRIKLRQSLRNLISNAIDIQPQGGRVAIETTEREHDVEFIVSDAGPGIPAEIVGRVTDPFFTTRAEGTGLGLSLVHTIAGLHRGAVTVHETPSDLGGARIQLRIPKSPQR